ncbi:MAG: radical SAM protein [Candidatus Gastranaerophilaceae bacterium]|jgi:radical SAM protein with 4Fe4S-binding SPASM domain
MKEKIFKKLLIEPTNKCNLKCPCCLCGRREVDKIKRELNLKQFVEILKPAINYLDEVKLWGFGEPFLAKDIAKMLGYLGENHVYAVLHTNGYFLNKKILSQLKLNRKVTISFSIDGLNQKSYSHYRVGGDLNVPLKNLSDLCKFKRDNKLNNLEIIWLFMINKANEHEIKELTVMARKIGVDKLRLKTISVHKNDPLYKYFIPSNKKYVRKRNDDEGRKECIFIDPGTPTIMCNGDVLPCCASYSPKLIMGNSLQENIINIWKNSKYKNFRHEYKKNINSFCNKKCGFARKSKIYIEEFNFNK